MRRVSVCFLDGRGSFIATQKEGIREIPRPAKKTAGSRDDVISIGVDYEK